MFLFGNIWTGEFGIQKLWTGRFRLVLKNYGLNSPVLSFEISGLETLELENLTAVSNLLRKKLIEQPSPEFQTLWIGEFGIPTRCGLEFPICSKNIWTEPSSLELDIFWAGGLNLSLKAYGLENPMFF